MTPHEPPPIEPYMLTIHPSGTYAYRKLTTVPTAEVLHEGGIEGPLEIVPLFRKLGLSPCIAFCDEDGRRKGLPPNRAAQALWRLAVGRMITEDHLVGPIVIVVGREAFLDRM
jgi:hypothetical protein